MISTMVISSDLCFNVAYPKLFTLIQTLAPDRTVNLSYLGQILVTSLSACSHQEDEEKIISPRPPCPEPANETVLPVLELISKSWCA